MQIVILSRNSDRQIIGAFSSRRLANMYINRNELKEDDYEYLHFNVNALLNLSFDWVSLMHSVAREYEDCFKRTKEITIERNLNDNERLCLQLGTIKYLDEEVESISKRAETAIKKVEQFFEQQK